MLWEAQFGDFINGAQVIIDQYLVAAEDKWNQRNGLVLLLPHGYEGQGPEHSSARIERFLLQAAEDNIQVCNATTAAQYFHLLRRQVHTERHTPLILFTPKQGLRMKQTRSPIDELTTGSFQEILDDPFVTDREAVRRIVFCSGKVAWDAMAERDKREAPVAVVRVEQLYPSPIDQLLQLLETLPERPPARVAAGGAGEHGRLELRRGPRVAGQGARLRPAPRRPRRVRQPGDRLQDDPRPGARRPHGGDLPGPLIRVLPGLDDRPPYRYGRGRCSYATCTTSRSTWPTSSGPWPSTSTCSAWSCCRAPTSAFAGAWLGFGGGRQVHLIEAAVPEDRGQHFAFQVDDIDAAVAALRASGTKVRGPVPVGDSAARQAFFHDPDGNRLELNQPA